MVPAPHCGARRRMALTVSRLALEYGVDECIRQPNIVGFDVVQQAARPAESAPHDFLAAVRNAAQPAHGEAAVAYQLAVTPLAYALFDGLQPSYELGLPLPRCGVGLRVGQRRVVGRTGPVADGSWFRGVVRNHGCVSCSP